MTGIRKNVQYRGMAGLVKSFQLRGTCTVVQDFHVLANIEGNPVNRETEVIEVSFYMYIHIGSGNLVCF